MTEEQGQSPLTRMNCEAGEGVLHCRFTGRWTIEAEDSVPNLSGSPGLFGSAKDAEIFLDNIKVTAN